MDESVQKHLKPLDTVSRLLLAAADVIERHGWCQNAVNTADGRVCLGGAIRFARFGSHDEDGWDSECIAAAVRVVKSVIVSYTAWNDARERTKEEVIAKLRSVALAG